MIQPSLLASVYNVQGAAFGVLLKVSCYGTHCLGPLQGPPYMECLAKLQRARPASTMAGASGCKRKFWGWRAPPEFQCCRTKLGMQSLRSLAPPMQRCTCSNRSRCWTNRYMMLRQSLLCSQTLASPPQQPCMRSKCALPMPDAAINKAGAMTGVI